jgi:hypothetical protein
MKNLNLLIISSSFFLIFSLNSILSLNSFAQQVNENNLTPVSIFIFNCQAGNDPESVFIKHEIKIDLSHAKVEELFWEAQLKSKCEDKLLTHFNLNVGYGKNIKMYLGNRLLDYDIAPPDKNSLYQFRFLPRYNGLRELTDVKKYTMPANYIPFEMRNTFNSDHRAQTNNNPSKMIASKIFSSVVLSLIPGVMPLAMLHNQFNLDSTNPQQKRAEAYKPNIDFDEYEEKELEGFCQQNNVKKESGENSGFSPMEKEFFDFSNSEHKY